jgi:hypothetical protein
MRGIMRRTGMRAGIVFSIVENAFYVVMTTRTPTCASVMWFIIIFRTIR